MQSRYLQEQQTGDGATAAANSSEGTTDAVSIFSVTNNSTSATTTMSNMTNNSTNSNSTANNSSSYDEEEEHMKQSLEQDAKAYLNSFPPQPETEFASSTFMTFSDPDRFSNDALRSTTHYLSDKLRGVVWLDVNSDGVRGSSSNRTMNAMEYDVGVGGAKVQLVHCDTDEILVAKQQQNTNHNDNNNNENENSATAKTDSSAVAKVEVITFPYEGGLANRTDVSAAGVYEFPLVSKNDDASSFVVPPGRYYVMFTAPKNFRIIGNMLPLDRERQKKDTTNEDNDEYYYEDAASVICTPFGGEGNAYRKKVEKIGDLDWEGHCGRSIGCFDVGKSFELKQKYPLLQLANDNQQEEKDGDDKDADDNDNDEEEMDMADFVGTIQNSVALPSRNTLNVGLSQDNWPLLTVQFADMQLTLAFPSGISDEELEYAQSFAANNVTRALQRSLSEYFHSKSPGGEKKFDIFGVDLHGSRVIDVDAYNAMREEQASAASTTTSSSVGNNACLARNPQKNPEEPPPREVTYNFTIRGRYDPPPQVKLGPSALQSINSDPTDLFERLIEEMSRNDNGGAPPVFQEVEGAVACHLTLEKAPVIVDMDIQCWSILPTMGDPLIECWAILPVILLSVSISSLLTFLLIRRARRLRLNALNEARKSISAYLHRRRGFVFR